MNSPGRQHPEFAQAELYLTDDQNKLVIIDEVHRSPGLLPALRGLIDRARRAGGAAGQCLASGQYLLLGSASPGLLKQASKSLAGRITYRELTPFSVLEAPRLPADELWLPGGFPNSLRATNTAYSLRGARTAYAPIWSATYHRSARASQSQPCVASGACSPIARAACSTLPNSRNLGADAQTAAAYLDLLVDRYLVGRLPAWHANLGKRLVKSPNVHVRDSNLDHALLAIPNRDTLLAHQVIGQSWECMAVENLLIAAAAKAQGYRKVIARLFPSHQQRCRKRLAPGLAEPLPVGD